MRAAFPCSVGIQRNVTSPDLRGNERFLFATLKVQIDRDSQKYEEKCAANKKNISKRWGNTENKPFDTNEYDRNNSYTKNTKEKAKEKEKAKTNEKGSLSLTTFEINNNARENLICECVASETHERCKRKSTYLINGKNYCNQHSKEILKNIETCEVKSPKKATYGEFKNVLLSEQEFKKLNAEYGAELLGIIEHLSAYIEMKGYKAKSHYLAIKKWVALAYQEQKMRETNLENRKNQTYGGGTQNADNKRNNNEFKPIRKCVNEYPE